jgi:ABC-type glycerol-3-phosphate transport system substrate-binding protein
MKTVRRIAAGLGVIAVALSFAGAAFASSVDTWRWDSKHAVKTWTWDGGTTCGVPDENGVATCTGVTNFRAKNIDTKAVKNATCKVVADASSGDGPDAAHYRFTHKFSFSVAPGATSPTDSFTWTAYTIPGWGLDWGEWPVWCSWNSTRIRA